MDAVKTENRYLILVRGLPGSGKSTLAAKFAEQGFHHFEADAYIERFGSYHHNAMDFPLAHEECRIDAETSLMAGYNVVVANTFVTQREIRPYELIAANRNARLVVINTQGRWGSIHNFPPEAISAMRRNWELFKDEIVLKESQISGFSFSDKLSVI